MATVELTAENFEETVLNNDIVVVDFWASWCGPCKAFAPVLEASSDKHTDIVHAKVNTEEQPALAGHFQIRSIPTLMVFREKIMLFNQAGALPAAAFEDLLTQVKNLDMDEVRAKIAEAQQGEA
ncbi:MAG: thioredoxin [Myxococcota bacterium]|nr:thioredoxin [Myxococcota bacterium]